MKILIQGKLPVEKVYQLGCHKCGTVFEFEKKEARSYNDRGEYVLLVDCPLCKTQLTAAI